MSDIEETIFYIGLDPATTSGYSVIRYNKETEKIEIVKYGEITLSSSLSVPQKLNVIAMELDKILAQFPPTYVFIEEPPYTYSGVKVLTNLARLNGVMIHRVFPYTQNISLLEPTFWKANSLPGLKGNSPKWKIQLEVCRSFSLFPERSNVDIESIDKLIESKENTYAIRKEEFEKSRSELDLAKRTIAYKRNHPTPDEKQQLQNKIKLLSEVVKSGKTELKSLRKEIDKELLQIGKDIYSQTGISDNIADAMCIAICGFNQVLEETKHGSTR